MPGQMIPRGTDRWLLRVYVGRDATGKRRYASQTVRGSKREAQRELTKMLRGKDTKTLLKPSRETVGAYLARWLDTWAAPRVRPRTLGDYRSIVRTYLAPDLGTVRLSQLSPSEIQDLYNGMLARGLSARTVRYAHSVLRSALAQAVKLNLIIRNPADLTEPPRKERREMGVMTKAQVSVFFEAAKGDRWEALWHLLLTSGLRPGEALGLKWDDLEGNKVRVQRVMIPGSRGTWRLAEPKTDRSRRVVVIPASTGRALREHRRKQARERLAAGEHYNDHGLMFAMPDGAPPNYRGLVLSHFKPILAKAGLPSFRPYDLRHTAATLLLSLGEHPKVVSERLGHSSTQQTMDTYSHVMPDMQEQSATRLEALVYG